jgi:hypothetical protein
LGTVFTPETTGILKPNTMIFNPINGYLLNVIAGIIAGNETQTVILSNNSPIKARRSESIFQNITLN